MLIEFFSINATDSEAKHLKLLYRDFPKYYVWDSQMQTWTKIKRNDSDIEKPMEEASTYRMPSELRRLFATLLHYCKPSNPRKMFETYYEHMLEDFRKTQSELNMSEEQILHKVLQGINDTLESLGKYINEYHLVPFKYITSNSERFTRDSL
ncbi:hypothetical protein LIER_34429 [Lithospermum erythrorhizon]|uniref:Uncharacterized protein n=1 Tax=Lithospermum erythrorhizon TaxID=34254 RepID=A0AAV3S3P7_LITER